MAEVITNYPASPSFMCYRGLKGQQLLNPGLER